MKGMLQFSISRVLQFSGSEMPLHVPVVVVVLVVAGGHELQNTGHVFFAVSPKSGWLQSLDTNVLQTTGSGWPWQVSVVVVGVLVVAVIVVVVVPVNVVLVAVVPVVVVAVVVVCVVVVCVVVVLDVVVAVDDDELLVVSMHVLHSAGHDACNAGPNVGSSQKKPARRSHSGGSMMPLHTPVVVVVVDVVVEAVVVVDDVFVVVVAVVLVSVSVVVLSVLVVPVSVVVVNVDVV